MRCASRGSWRITRESATASALHAGSAAAVGGPVPPRRTVRILEAVTPALVLGSSQPESDADPVALVASGVELARRRSGGGAVLVGPGLVLWIDFVIPASDPLWQRDVGRAAWWLGDLWAGALRDIGAGRPEVWTGPMRPTRWSTKVCFAGTGPGEVHVAGRKVVGISQRRNQRAALFQSAALLDWEPERTVGLLALPPAERLDATQQLRSSCLGVGAARRPDLLAAVVKALLP